MGTYDTLDFHILVSIIVSKDIKLSKIIKIYPSWKKTKFETSGQKELYRLNQIGTLKNRLRKFMREDLVFLKKDKDGKSNIYVVNKLKVKLLSKHKFLKKYKKAIWIQERDGIECIFSL